MTFSCVPGSKTVNKKGPIDQGTPEGTPTNGNTPDPEPSGTPTDLEDPFIFNVMRLGGHSWISSTDFNLQFTQDAFKTDHRLKVKVEVLNSPANPSPNTYKTKTSGGIQTFTCPQIPQHGPYNTMQMKVQVCTYNDQMSEYYSQPCYSPINEMSSTNVGSVSNVMEFTTIPNSDKFVIVISEQKWDITCADCKNQGWNYPPDYVCDNQFCPLGTTAWYAPNPPWYEGECHAFKVHLSTSFTRDF